MRPLPAQQALGFGDDAGATLGLRHWPPDGPMPALAWGDLVRDFLASDTGRTLSARMVDALNAGKTIFPATPFKALELTPLSQVRVVILGQDPYHGPGQAEGLAFSVPSGVRLPPSLRNIFKELQLSLHLPMPHHGSLEHWARQGVLLLNTCLTVESGQAASHARWGWEALTDAVVAAVAKSQPHVVFILWGAHAQAKKSVIDTAAPDGRHLVLQANHPSPLSALRPPLPFLGCGHFAQANAFLAKTGEKPVEW
jgi:uracil-DNA glycosylase